MDWYTLLNSGSRVLHSFINSDSSSWFIMFRIRCILSRSKEKDINIEGNMCDTPNRQTKKNSKHGLLSQGNSRFDSVSAWVKHGNYALEYGQNVCGHADDEDDMAVFGFVCISDVYKFLIMI